MEWVLIGLVGLVLLSAKTVEKVVKTIMDRGEFVKQATQAARAVSSESGIPALLIVTQAAHESNFGNSGLTHKANNLFGIKASTGWTGDKINLPTHEVINGQTIAVDAYFRKYSSWEASIRDWLKFISRPRYAAAYAAAVAGDSKTFFQELQRAGYATDPNYSTALVQVLNRIQSLV